MAPNARVFAFNFVQFAAVWPKFGTKIPLFATLPAEASQIPLRICNGIVEGAGVCSAVGPYVFMGRRLKLSAEQVNALRLDFAFYNHNNQRDQEISRDYLLGDCPKPPQI